MALQDILDAIVSDANRQIADARTAHQKRLSQLREESDRRLVKKKQDINAQREDKKRQMHMKGEAAMTVHRRNALLSTKRALLDHVYADIERQLAQQPPAKIKPLLQGLLAHIHGTGVIRPAKAHAALLADLLKGNARLTPGEPLQTSGGFVFVSEKEERDCTFATLVNDILRPQTEAAVAGQLFPPLS